MVDYDTHQQESIPRGFSSLTLADEPVLLTQPALPNDSNLKKIGAYHKVYRTTLESSKIFRRYHQHEKALAAIPAPKTKPQKRIKKVVLTPRSLTKLFFEKNGKVNISCKLRKE